MGLRLIIFFTVATLSCCTHFRVKDSQQMPDPSHGIATPNYDIVFPENEVLRIDINVDSMQWNSMLADLNSNQRPNHKGLRQNEPPKVPPMLNKGIHPPHLGPNQKAQKPRWAKCTVTFNEDTWFDVGLRFKGNSSLRETRAKGSIKFPFKLDFDQFEDSIPERHNQRFYGFKQLNLNNNFDDASCMREKVAADLFRDFGLPAAKTAFCQVYLNTGKGSQYLGLYTLVEEMDDTGIPHNYKASKGNLYKPEGQAATFAQGTFRTSEMNVKHHQSDTYSDVKTLYQTLNSPLRQSAPEAWQHKLDSVFNIPQFLKWLAANTTIQNWDAYGKTFHNYYLYHNPGTQKLDWIPWDHNEAFQKGKMGGAPSLSLNEVNEHWPLIHSILNVPEYRAMYKYNVQQFNNEVFNARTMMKTYDNYYELFKKSGVKEANSHEMMDAIRKLKLQVNERNVAVAQYINKSD